ncbi:hypothetical protein COCMIDRAFT_102279, partial [Bipolaris oryzae ATCC 44560]
CLFCGTSRGKNGVARWERCVCGVSEGLVTHRLRVGCICLLMIMMMMMFHKVVRFGRQGSQMEGK